MKNPGHTRGGGAGKVEDRRFHEPGRRLDRLDSTRAPTLACARGSDCISRTPPSIAAMSCNAQRVVLAAVWR